MYVLLNTNYKTHNLHFYMHIMSYEQPVKHGSFGVFVSEPGMFSSFVLFPCT